MVKKKPMVIGSNKPKEQVNKKAIIWSASIAVAVVIVMAVLLIVTDK